jgi:hypothetical protein
VGGLFGFLHLAQALENARFASLAHFKILPLRTL